MTEQLPSKWVVSKGRNAALSRATPVDVETDRYRLLSNSIREVQTEHELVQEIGKLWLEAQEKFLAIGRYLLRAKLQFHRTFEATILPELPFGKGVAYQLRAVAAAVDEGRILEEELPHSYATAYQLVSLSADQFMRARAENLVRKDVLRREIDGFKQKMRGPAEGDREGQLVVEWRRLQSEMARIVARQKEIEAALGPELTRIGLIQDQRS